MDQISLLQAKLNANSLEISSLKKRVEQLELEQHKIGIAIEVITSLTSPPETAFVGGVQIEPMIFGGVIQQGGNEPLATRVIGAIGRLRNGKPTIKQLILNELAKASPLTKMDLVSRLAVPGRDVNSITIGTTLSKMVGNELEKVEMAGRPLAYRLKGETAQGGDPNAVSGATESSGSLI
jgi:hypothetical protein